MRQKLIVNDVHLGVTRSAGTTPKTSAQLRAYLLSNLETLMFEHKDKDIIFNGDVFDEFDVPLTEAFEFLMLCRKWLDVSEGTLYLAEGNHDLSKNSANMCSLAFVAKALNSDRVVLIEQTTHLEDAKILVIPHVANQDLFDLELAKAAEMSDTLILVHANYDNNFAVKSDHSLNVSAAQAHKVIENANTLLFGHEHQQRNVHKRIQVAGNQWPSSVADCLGNNSKKAFIFDPVSRSMNTVETWTREGSYAEIDWQFLGQAEDSEFVRVVGDCATEQAAEMISEISKFRQRSDAFVVTNAVSVAGVVAMQDLPANLENVKGFDVMGYLFENLDDAQVAVVKGLLEKANG